MTNHIGDPHNFTPEQCGENAQKMFRFISEGRYERDILGTAIALLEKMIDGAGGLEAAGITQEEFDAVSSAPARAAYRHRPHAEILHPTGG